MSWGPGTHQEAIDEIDRLTADLEREKIVRIELMALIAKLQTALMKIRTIMSE